MKKFLTFILFLGTLYSAPMYKVNFSTTDKTTMDLSGDINVYSSTSAINPNVRILGSGNVYATNGYFNNIQQSTTSLQNQINDLYISTNTLKVRVDNLDVSTTTLNTRINNIAISTGLINTDLQISKINISNSTSSLQNQINNIAISTGLINTDLQISKINISNSTSSLQTQVNNIAISTGIINTDLQTSKTNIANSTSSLQNQINNLTFLSLTDTPSSYSGQAGKLVMVNSQGNGLIFSEVSSAGDNLGNHIATQNLNMSNNSIVNVSTITFTDGTILTSTKPIGDLSIRVNNIAISTGNIQTQVNNIAISTGNIQTQVNNIAVSTGNLQNQVNNIAVSTGTLVRKSGDTMSGNLNMSNNAILNVSTLTASYIDVSSINANNILQKVSEIIIQSDTTYVEFTGLSGRYFYLVCLFRNVSGTGSSYYIYFNGNYTTTNYYHQNIYAQGTSANFNFINNSEIAYAASGFSTISFIDIFCDRVGSLDGFVNYYSRSVRNRYSTSSAANQLYAGWTNFYSSEITSIRISAVSTNAISQGSRFILYQYKE